MLETDLSTCIGHIETRLRDVEKQVAVTASNQRIVISMLAANFTLLGVVLGAVLLK